MGSGRQRIRLLLPSEPPLKCPIGSRNWLRVMRVIRKKNSASHNDLPLFATVVSNTLDGDKDQIVFVARQNSHAFMIYEIMQQMMAIRGCGELPAVRRQSCRRRCVLSIGAPRTFGAANTRANG